MVKLHDREKEEGIKIKERVKKGSREKEQAKRIWGMVSVKKETSVVITKYLIVMKSSIHM